MQEAALLCRGILERRNESDERRSFVFGEAEMRLYAETCEARRAAAHEKKPPRRPAQNLGSAWRGAQATTARVAETSPGSFKPGKLL
jgi:hypothetical protein